MDVAEIRGWAQLSFIVIGGTIGLIAFFQNMRQRRVENAFKMIAWFNSTLQRHDMEDWIKLFHYAYEPAGAEPGHYVDVEGNQFSISGYYSEGSPDSGSIARMTDSLEVVCHELVKGTVETRLVWFELGQLLRTIHYWLSCIPSYREGTSLLEESFPNIAKAYKKHEKNFNRWPSRTIAYVE